MKGIFKGNILFQFYKIRHIRFSRHYSASVTEQNQFFSCETIQSDGHRIFNLSLCHKPVNVLSIDLMKSLTGLFHRIKLGAIPTDALIIKSSIPGVFSSGLDLRSLLVDKDSNPDIILNYYSVFQSFWLSLYSLELPVISVIGGTCLAAGCAIALAADYRIICDGTYKIGIIATKLGLSPPFWLRQALMNVVGSAQADRALQTSRLFSPRESLNISLADKIVSIEESQAAALLAVKDFLSVDPQARGITKMHFRKKLIHDMDKEFLSDRDEFLRILSAESTQRNIIQLLSKK